MGNRAGVESGEVRSRTFSAGRIEWPSPVAEATSLVRIFAAIAALPTASGQFIIPDDDPLTVTSVVSDSLVCLAADFVSPALFAQQLWDPLDEQA
ncbi:MAG: hypothetical protein ND866_10490 [Pyrinomonadaceae bacterium]|nr:hypothetical protein [Pyrinomonadaceae bacterium]